MVLPPAERLVQVESDKGAHADAAVRLPFPHRSITASTEADMRAAVSHAVTHRHYLSEFRSDACNTCMASCGGVVDGVFSLERAALTICCPLLLICLR